MIIIVCAFCSSVRGVIHWQHSLHHIRFGWTFAGAPSLEGLLPRCRCHRLPHRCLRSGTFARGQGGTWCMFVAICSPNYLHSWLSFSLFGQSLLCDEQLSNCPVLILGNKIDKAGACGEDEIRQYFNLHGQTTGKVRRRLVLTRLIMKFFAFLLGSRCTSWSSWQASGVVHVLCVASSRIWRRLPLASSIHLNTPTPTTHARTQWPRRLGGNGRELLNLVCKTPYNHPTIQVNSCLLLLPSLTQFCGHFFLFSSPPSASSFYASFFIFIKKSTIQNTNTHTHTNAIAAYLRCCWPVGTSFWIPPFVRSRTVRSLSIHTNFKMQFLYVLIDWKKCSFLHTPLE